MKHLSYFISVSYEMTVKSSVLTISLIYIKIAYVGNISYNKEIPLPADFAESVC